LQVAQVVASVQVAQLEFKQALQTPASFQNPALQVAHLDISTVPVVTQAEQLATVQVLTHFFVTKSI
jgi:hypothetical protein